MLVVFLGLAIIFANAQTKTAIETKDLKKEIAENLTKDYKDFQVIKAFKVDTKGVVTFEIMAKKDKEFLILTYDENGKFLKKIEPRKEAQKPKVEPRKDEPVKDEPKKEEPKK